MYVPYMSEMKIIVSEYTREDGVQAIRIKEGQWVLRSILGPAWFWDVTINDWQISTMRGFQLESFAMTVDKALTLLAVVKKKEFPPL